MFVQSDWVNSQNDCGPPVLERFITSSVRDLTLPYIGMTRLYCMEIQLNVIFPRSIILS